jgi:hypothetical protein
MTIRLQFFLFLPNATKIGIAPPATSAICLARFLGCFSRLPFISASNRSTAARIATKTLWNESGRSNAPRAAELRLRGRPLHHFCIWPA